MNKIAFLFPGQGSQFVGMGKDIYQNYSAGQNIYEKVDKILNRNISKICFCTRADFLDSLKKLKEKLDGSV